MKSYRMSKKERVLNLALGMGLGVGMAANVYYHGTPFTYTLGALSVPLVCNGIADSIKGEWGFTVREVSSLIRQS